MKIATIGRTNRIFLQAIAKSKGFHWNFDNMDRDSYMLAMIQSVTNADLLEKLFLDTLKLKQ